MSFSGVFKFIKTLIFRLKSNRGANYGRFVAHRNGYDPSGDPMARGKHFNVRG